MPWKQSADPVMHCGHQLKMLLLAASLKTPDKPASGLMEEPALPEQREGHAATIKSAEQ